MHNAKDLLNFTSHLSVLYVEDDETLREETTFLLEVFFEKLDTAVDGLDGLKMYNNNEYDIVITDINMPNMNGIEMITEIKEINPEQKILAISAHNESDILISLIKLGVSGFILKPILQEEVINALYPISRDAYSQILNIKLVNELNERHSELEERYKQLNTQNSVIDIKHNQVQELLKEKVLHKQVSTTDSDKSLVSEYFAQETSENEENVVFLKDHADDIEEYFYEIVQELSKAVTDLSEEKILKISSTILRVSSILLHYTPYLDKLSSAFNELHVALDEHQELFMKLLQEDSDGVLMLFDAINADMERYIKRFSVESLAMSNAHHIHEPTVLSIQQVISLFVPNQFEDSEIDFF